MSIEDEFEVVLEKVNKMQGDARLAFLSRLGQLEEDLKSEDLSSALYSAALLLKAYQQSHACSARAARLTFGKTRLNAFKRVKRDKDVYYGSTIKDESTTVEEHFENDLSKLPIEAQDLIRRWNAIISLPRILSLEGRLPVIKKAFTSPFFKTYWQDGLYKLARSKFLTGGGSKRWRATIDWFLAPPNLQNIISGQYDDTKPSQPTENKQYNGKEI